jgi:hypothetical protein
MKKFLEASFAMGDIHEEFVVIASELHREVFVSKGDRELLF